MAAPQEPTPQTVGHEPTGWDYDHVNDPNAPTNLETALEELEPDHGHNDFSQLVAIPITDEEIEAASTQDYVRWKQEHAEKPHKELGFEYAEHSYLGNSLTLEWDDGERYVANNKPIKLPNGLEVTYGEINGLAGDFYGTVNPISDGHDFEEQCNRFRRAWHWLAEDTTRNPAEARNILNTLSTEVRMVQDALDKGLDPSTVYPKIPDVNFELQKETLFRPGECPSYLGLAKINWDHFGQDARTTYNACHSVALQVAKEGNLPLAYAMNAFGDHFLQDSFAAGHMRTPRRKLHDSTGMADLCAKFMHDEDNAIGLTVRNPAGRTWHTYGDKRLLDKEDISNKAEAWNAVRASADEIYEAWKTKIVPEPAKYAAWEHAPILSQVQSIVAPLFREDGQRRADIRKRCQAKYTNNYWYWSTAADYCQV
ncbi:phosphatidylcholine-hydrolyzing phospholipase C [Fusarium napiforme]|uniref:Phosphatidylcholine-hydrolyzing phospholipase C n=1 Tax=Fusarium napiforme TaxID=42672 RepID=A0A8H5MTN8_9HYPO|nr:phosphatidylcholine-hydrolyzing phospholipase C [Fusarium napiforme]